MLNRRAWQLCDDLVADHERLRATVERTESGVRLIDCGVHALGGLETGLRLAEICLAGLARVTLERGHADQLPGPAISVTTDQPLLACMAAQYAGWRVAGEKFFAMGSGPMRALAGKEALVAEFDLGETDDVAVGVLETGQLPPTAVQLELAKACRVEPQNLTLLVAPTASLAGTLQVVARSVETALHKLHELKFDLRQIVSGWGSAPLPPVAADDLAAIGRTNDAIIYGGLAVLWVRCADELLERVGPSVPSNSSADHGQPFASIFARAGHDFYKIDPRLFSPAVVTFHNLDSGNAFRFGELSPQVLEQSFARRGG